MAGSEETPGTRIGLHIGERRKNTLHGCSWANVRSGRGWYIRLVHGLPHFTPRYLHISPTAKQRVNTQFYPSFISEGKGDPRYYNPFSARLVRGQNTR